MDKKKIFLIFVIIIFSFFIFLIELTTAQFPQAQYNIGNLIIRLLCLLFFIFPAILTLLFVVAGALILTGEKRNRIVGKRLIVSGVISLLILIFLTFLVLLTTPDLKFQDFFPCFIGGEPPGYPAPPPTQGSQSPWADARVGLSTDSITEKEVSTSPGTLVYFDASNSKDFDGNIEKYEWNFGDGSSTVEGISPSHSYQAQGTFIAELKVTDNDGLTGNDIVKINLRPLEAYILNPKYGQGFVISGEDINFVGEGRYGAPCIPPKALYEYTWESNIKGFLSNENSFALKTSELGLGSHQIKFTVKDCQNNIAFDTITIHIVPPLNVKILKPQNDNEKMSCPAIFEGKVSGGMPPYKVQWSADGTVFGSGTIKNDGGTQTLSLQTPTQNLKDGVHNIKFEAEDSIGLKGEDEKKNIEIKRCYEIFDLVFVSVGASASQFNSDANFALQDFLRKSPFKDCPNPSERVKAHFLGPDKCRVSGCSNHCGDCIGKGRRCVRDNGLGSIYDKFAVITPGGGWRGGCAGAIPNDGESSSAGFPQVHVHELGHNLGLYHIDSICGRPAGACIGPNAGDCNEPDKRQDIMTYCMIFAKYGPRAYQYMKTSNSSLAPFLRGCS